MTPTEPVAGLVPYRTDARWRIRRVWTNRFNAVAYIIERRWWVFWVEQGIEIDELEARRTLARMKFREDMRRAPPTTVAEVDDDGNWS